MAFTITLPTLGNDSQDWGTIVNQALTDIQTEVRSVETGASITSGAITEDKLAISNSPLTNGILSYGSGSLVWQSQLIPAQISASGTPADGSMVVYQNTGGYKYLAAVSDTQIASDAVTESKLAISNSLTSGQVNYLTANTSGEMAWTTTINPSTAFSDSSIPISKVLIDATPLNNYTIKWDSGTGKPYWSASAAVNLDGKVKHDTNAVFQFAGEWRDSYVFPAIRDTGSITVFGKLTQITTGISADTIMMLDKTYQGSEFKLLTASVIRPGVTGTLSIQVLRRRDTELIGDSTTTWNITRPGTPNANTTRYTWSGSGTNPNISDADSSLRVGDYLMVYAKNFNAGNIGEFKLTAVGSNYFEITNTSGVAESAKSTDTGYILPMKKLLSTEVTITTGFRASNGVVNSNRKTLAEGDILMPEVTATHTTSPYGLLIAYRFGGINVSD